MTVKRTCSFTLIGILAVALPGCEKPVSAPAPDEPAQTIPDQPPEQEPDEERETDRKIDLDVDVGDNGVQVDVGDDGIQVDVGENGVQVDVDDDTEQ